jgi:ribokinase
MAKFLQQILDLDEPHFSIGIAELEKANGHQGIDTRVIADVTHKAHEVMRRLGLDVADTTGEELYHALAMTIKTRVGQDILLGADFVLLPFDEGAVSFNLIDVIDNAHHELDYKHRIASHGQRALRGEIIGRYLEQGPAHQDVTKAIGKEMGLLRESDQWYSDDKVIQKQTEGTDVKPYILSIGDIFTDAFIKLNEDVARIDTDEDGSKRISLPLGTKPPYDEVEIIRAVGPSPNAAVAIARLGLESGLDSFIGDDAVGTEAIQKLKKEGVKTDTMLVEKGIKTNYYFVLRYGAERTILVKNEQFDYTWTPPQKEPDWIYLALISDASWKFHVGLLAYLQEHPHVKLAFQPGTFHFKWGVEKLAGIYKRSHIIVLNREEAVDVTGRSYDSIKELAQGLHELGPEKVVITDGPKGSYASYDFKLVTIPNYPDPAPPLDRTGAGDAFASTIVAALALGESMETALNWAPINSASVVQKLGAQAGLLSRSELQEWLMKAPDDYKIRDYNE